MRPGLRTSLLAVLLFLGMVSPAWAPLIEKPPAQAFAIQLTLDSNEAIFVRTYELAEEPRPLGPRLTVKTGLLEGLGTFQVGQSFDVATLRILDAAMLPLATYQLSSVRVTALRDSGELSGLTREIVLSGKTLSVSFHQ